VGWECSPHWELNIIFQSENLKGRDQDIDEMTIKMELKETGYANIAIVNGMPLPESLLKHVTL
jgi:hypothetical protein